MGKTSIPINEPAKFFTNPGDDGTEFETLADALIHASQIPSRQRHKRARIETASGLAYQWNAILRMREIVRETEA